MKKLFTIFLLVFVISCSKSNKANTIVDSNSDSLFVYLRLAKSETATKKVRDLSYKKAFNILIRQKNDSITRAKLFEISLGFFNDGNWPAFNKVSNRLLEDAIESRDTLNQALVYRYKAGYYKKNNISDSSFYYFLKAERLFRKTRDNGNLGSVLSYKSAVQYNEGDYVGADKSLTEAYKLLKDSNDYQKLYVIYTMMGIVANESKEYSNSLDYYNKALKLIRENNLNNDYQEANCLNNIGYVYQNKGEYQNGIKIFKLALRDHTILNNKPDLYSYLVDNLAYCKFKIRQNDALPNQFYEALQIREKIEASTLVVLSKIHLSEYYAYTKDTLRARQFAKEALLLSMTNGIPRDLLASLKQSSVVDHEQASKFSKDYIRISDSINDVERLSKEKFARLELETNEIIQENEGLAEKNRTLLYVFIVSFIVVGLLFVVRAQRARTRELLYKQAQQKANEDIYNLLMSQQAIIDESRSKEKKRLAQDLHDGILGRMFGLRLNLDSLNGNADEESTQKRFELLNELKTIEQDIREISHDLNREKQVLINNFVSIVHNLLEEQNSSHDAKLSYSLDNDINWDKIGNAIKINLYRILQESLQNINKYANAKNLFVEIKGDYDNVSLKIEDDGIGFDVNRKSKGIGMQNMISRTHDCNGIIDISSKKNEGTKIIVTLPTENKPIIVES